VVGAGEEGWGGWSCDEMVDRGEEEAETLPGIIICQRALGHHVTSDDFLDFLFKLSIHRGTISASIITAAVKW